MPQIYNEGWLNANALRAYPLHEDATRQVGSFVLPDDLIVDLIFPIHSAGGFDPSLFHIKTLTIFSGGITISLGYADTDVIAAVTISTSTFVENSVFALNGVGDFVDSQGKIVIGKLSTTLEKGAGAFEFDVAAGRLEAAVIRPDIRGVTGFRLRNVDDLSDLIQGDVVLQAGVNTRIRVDTSGAVPRIIFDAVADEDFNEGCDCEEDLQPGDPIRTINGVPPDAFGNFTFFGDDCITITPDSAIAGLRFSDACSKPCCGCTELDIIVRDLQDLASQTFSLENFATRLEDKMGVMGSVLSQFDGRGAENCGGTGSV